MAYEPITILDGDLELTIKVMKEFFGLRPDQSFQEIEVDDEDEDEVETDEE